MSRYEGILAFFSILIMALASLLLVIMLVGHTSADITVYEDGSFKGCIKGELCDD